MRIYPAIDLKGGRVVRLEQGRADRETVYFEDAAIPAGRFAEAGAEWIHVVDLDGAFSGKQANADAIGRILASGLKIELGGGIRSLDDARRVVDLGVSRFVVGTKAVESIDLVREMVAAFGDKVAVGIDAKDGKVATKGWVAISEIDAHELARRVTDVGVQTIIYTDISRDGMMTGPNFEAQEAMLQQTQANIIASGGVAALADIKTFAGLAKRYSNLDGVISGKALYDGRLDLRAAIGAAGG